MRPLWPPPITIASYELAMTSAPFGFRARPGGPTPTLTGRSVYGSGPPRRKTGRRAWRNLDCPGCHGLNEHSDFGDGSATTALRGPPGPDPGRGRPGDRPPGALRDPHLRHRVGRRDQLGARSVLLRVEGSAARRGADVRRRAVLRGDDGRSRGGPERPRAVN